MNVFIVKIWHIECTPAHATRTLTDLQVRQVPPHNFPSTRASSQLVLFILTCVRFLRTFSTEGFVETAESGNFTGP